MEARDLLPNPDEAVVVAAAPKPNAADAVVLAPSEPNANPAVSSPKKTQTIDTECRECWVLQQLWFCSLSRWSGS